MKLFRGGILLGLLVALPFGAKGNQDTNWTGNSSGAWESGSNWNNGEPTGSTSAGIYPGSSFSTTDNFASGTNGISTYTISLSSGSDAARYLAISTGFDTTVDTLTTPAGIVNLNLKSGAALTLGQSPTFGDPASLAIGGEATVNVSGGTLNIDDGAWIGIPFIFTIENSHPTQNFTVSGQGALNLSGTTLNFTNGLLDGVGPGGNGTITQTTSTVIGDSLDVGFDGGTGAYNLQSGSLTVSVGNLASGSGSTGTFTQTGGTSEFTTSLTVGTDGAGNFNLNAGTATLDGTLDLGLNSGSTGTLTQLTGTTLTVANASFIGDMGTGNFNLSGGTATFSGDLTLGSQASSSGTITQTGGTLEVDGTMTVGDSGTGVYTMSGHSVANLFGNLTLGGTTGPGTLTETAGTLNVSGTTLIGDAGTGTMSLNGGTGTFTGAVTLGNSGGNGVLNLSGSTATFDGGITVDATGTVTQTGGTATVTGGIDLTATGSSYNLNGGTLKVDTLTGGTGDGTFNFGGGTLQASTVGALTDNLDGTVTGNSTLDATNNNITLGGNLTGSGGFTVIGGNNVNLTLSANATTAAAYTGATVISGGNLILNSPDGTDVFASAISGTSGTLVINPATTTSTVRLPGTINFTGTTTINNTGFLNVYNGTLGSVAGTNANLIVGQDGSQGTFGAAATPYPTSGTVNLTGTNSYTGSTQVFNGFTLFASNLATSMTTNTGTFGQNGTVGTTVDFGASYSQPQEATTAAEGTLLVRVAGNVADNYSATTATMYGTVGVSGYSAVGTTSYDVVSTGAGGLTTGTLNSATAAGLATNVKNSTLLSAELSFSNTAIVTTPTAGETNLYLVVTQLPLTEFALTPNQVAVAQALDPGFGSSSDGSVLSALDSLTSASQIPGALDQLSPRAYLDMRNITFENSTFLAENMHTRMEAMRDGFSGVDTSGLSIVAPGFESNLGRSLGSMLAYNGEGVAPNGVNYYPQDETAPPYAPPASSLTTPEGSSRTISDSPNGNMAPTSANPSSSVFNAPNFSEFISGDLILADLKEDQSANNIPETHYTAADVTAGVGFKITPHLIGGVLFDYNHTDARTDSQGSHVRVDTYSPGAFATLSDGGLYVDGLFNFGYNNYSNNRIISVAGNNLNATSKPSGQQYVGDLDLGYNFHPDHEGHWALGPEVGLEYVHLDVDSFTETGAGPADLSVDSQGADSLRGRLGGRLSYFTRSGSIVFAPTVFASFQHEFLNDPFGLTSQFNIPGTTPFTIQGTNPGRNSALIGVGASATFDNAMSIYLNYLAEIGADDYLVQSVQGGLKASF
jgi:uncharacterized protein with beta-barrel porin domain